MTAPALPALSIIVPVYGNPRYLPEALLSIRAQNAERCEVIVVDDGCRSRLDEMVRALVPDAIILRQANAGPAAARNYGVRAATNDIVAFLDADDRWTGHALAVLAKGFRDAPHAEVVQGHVLRFETSSSGKERRLGGPYLGFNVGALLVRRNTLLGCGLFDESLRASEDVDLLLRMHERGVRRLMIPDVVLEYRRHPGSLTEGAPPRVLGHGAPENWIRLLHNGMVRRRAVGRSPAPIMRSPRYSVVMVVRNGRRYLPAALECVRRQSAAPVEIVAIVGMSEDGTFSYLEAQPDVRVIRQAGSELADARNQGIEEAREERIAFLDHDDLWKPRKMEAQLGVLDLFERSAASITRFRIVHDADANNPALVKASADPLPRLGWTPSALLADRDLFRTVGWFDPAAGMGCDTDWFRRLRLSNAPCGVASGVLLDKRVHEANLSRDHANNRAAMFRVLQKHRAEQRRP